MTPNELSILKSLVVVAWADGTVEKPEEDLIEALLSAFAADKTERAAILDFASQKRNLVKDLPLKELGFEDREILLANAAVIARADGYESPEEVSLLKELVKVLEIPAERVEKIFASAKDGLLELGTGVLDDVFEELE